MSNTIDNPTGTPDETPAPPPTEAPSAATTEPVTPATPAAPPSAPPSPPDRRSRVADWFSASWRGGLAAVVIVIVAGAFFTIGWFTSTRGESRLVIGPIHLGQLVDPDGQSPSEGWTCPLNPFGPHGPWRGQGPFQQDTPATPEAPSDQQAPGDRQAPRDGQAPRDRQSPPDKRSPSDQESPFGGTAYLGVRIATINPALQDFFDLSRTSGVLIVGIDDEGPASRTDLRQGDVIVSFDGTAVSTHEELISLVGKKKPGDTVRLDVERGGQSLTVDVTLGTKPGAVVG